MKDQVFFLAEVPPEILSLVNARVAGMAGPAPQVGAGAGAGGAVCLMRSPTVRGLGYSYE